MSHLSKSKAYSNRKLRIKEVEAERPRCSFTLLPLSPLSLIDGLSRTSLSYDKLPEEPLKLSILKLDGSCFNIEVPKTANVAELKLAVEAVFSHLPQKGPGHISWPHVWGHFCLSYNGQKLTVDTEYITDYAIKDGDQLRFMRHVSFTCNLVKTRPKKKGFDASKRSNKPRPQPISCEEEDESEKERHRSNERENRKKLHHYADQGCFSKRNEMKLSHLLGEWFPTIVPVGRRRVERLPCHSKASSAGLLRGFKKIVQRCSKKWQPGSDSLRNTASSKRFLVK